MSENVVTSASINEAPAKKTPVKKAVAKPKVEAPVKKKTPSVSPDKVVIVFESGSSYTTDDFRFTRENNIQEVTPEQSEYLLTLENFRKPNDFEIENYLASKED